MNTLQKDIPLLLREKLGEELVENIQGYYYSVSYETTDWDYPIDDTYLDEERMMTDGTYSSNRGFLDYYIRNGRHNSLMLTVNSAYIDIYLSNGGSIRIEEKDSLSIAYGAFEGLRSWLEKRFKNADAQHSDASRHIRLSAWNVRFDKATLTAKKTGPVEFEVPITEEQEERIRTGMLGSNNYNPYSYGEWAEKGEAAIAEQYGPQHPLARINLGWAEGERQRLTKGCRFITREDIDAKLSFLESLGDTLPIREEVLAGIEDCFIWKETWTRETGHLWNKYTLLKRTPTQDEYDYADTWDFNHIRLRAFTTETIIKMLKEYRE